MIKLSEFAARALLERLHASGIGPDDGLGLKEEEGHFILQLDTLTENDRVICQDKAVVLIIGKDVEVKIDKAVIDIEEGTEEHLVMRKTSKDGHES